MSYSFTVKAATKAAAKEQMAVKLDEVIAAQPSHAKDRDAALAAASAFIDLVQDPPEGDHVLVNVNGSVGWRSDNPDVLVGAGFNVSVSITR